MEIQERRLEDAIQLGFKDTEWDDQPRNVDGFQKLGNGLSSRSSLKEQSSANSLALAQQDPF